LVLTSSNLEKLALAFWSMLASFVESIQLVFESTRNKLATAVSSSSQRFVLRISKELWPLDAFPATNLELAYWSRAAMELRGFEEMCSPLGHV
jgi:hypothetical protein